VVVNNSTNIDNTSNIDYKKTLHLLMEIQSWFVQAQNVAA
jgi:hypothetical protein